MLKHYSGQEGQILAIHTYIYKISNHNFNCKIILPIIIYGKHILVKLYGQSAWISNLILHSDNF